MKPLSRAAKRRPLNVLELRPERDGNGGDLVVRVFVDGMDLLDRVRRIELPLVAVQGRPEIAGTYRGLPPGDWAGLSSRDDEGRVAILGCECGEVGCWPLKARIVVDRATVTWRDFLSPAVGPMDSLGPFTFARDRYEAEVARMAGRA